MAVDKLYDAEFGNIPIQRRKNAKYVRLRIDHDGKLRATLPRFATIKQLSNLIEKSRPKLRQALASQSHLLPPTYEPNMKVGYHHKIVLKAGRAGARKGKDSIFWSVPENEHYTQTKHQDIIRRAVRRALNDQAESYLPSRLQSLSQMMDCKYSGVRFANQKGRWGSCSTAGVISLNVALMKLPEALIDYVLVHELAHTKHMNHSADFWNLVEQFYPEYRLARKELRDYSPYL